jgi:hypothetical protein
MRLLTLLFGWLGKLIGWLVGRPTPETPPGAKPLPTPVSPQPKPSSPPPFDLTPDLPDDKPGEPVSQPSPGNETAPARQWTVMIYMAGDNGLKFQTEQGWMQLMAEMTSAGYTDIAELRQAGTTDQVACVVQFDTVTEHNQSYRIIINAKGEAPTVLNIPETNTGDPNTLRDFIVWGQKTYPANHYAVVIWNHGGGWKEDDLWASVRDVAPKRPAVFRTTSMKVSDNIVELAAGSARAGDGGSAPRRVLDEADAGPTEQPETAGEPRWIAADDSSKDFLDNRELQRAFQEARSITGHPVDIIGMDACLMAMVEVAYQLRQEASLLVASEEIEPMPGWPYTTVLDSLTERPDQSPEMFAQNIVELYNRSYPSPETEITMSAIHLDRLESLATALRGFVDAVEDNWSDPAIPIALERAKLYALGFEDSEYRDLVDFLRQTTAELAKLRQDERVSDTTGIDSVYQAATSVLSLFDDPTTSPVLTTLVKGQRFLDAETGEPRVHGLAIYLPATAMSIYYENLDFRESRWADLLTLLLGDISPGDDRRTTTS